MRRYRAEGAVLDADSGQSRFGQRGPEPPIAARGLARLVLAGALVVAGAEFGPLRGVPGRREHPHVWPKFGDKHLGRPVIDAGNGVQSLDGGRRREPTGSRSRR